MALIIYELNELPIEVLEIYSSLYPSGFLGKAYFQERFRVTFCPDQGELHPWSTWPTVYRGVDNRVHKITTLNQDPTSSREFQPVWEVLRNIGITTGIFGTLQSGKVCRKKESLFHLPHTFAEDSDAHPDELSLLQDLNLKACAINKGTAGNVSSDVIVALIRLMQRPKIFAAVMQALLRYCWNSFWSLRPVPMSALQCMILFEAYLAMYGRFKPKMSTFFTNHLASEMHRYWNEAFTTENHAGRQIKMERFKRSRICKAMRLADDQLKRLTLSNPHRETKIWVISSMGQEFIDRGVYIPEPRLISEEQFLKRLPFSWVRDVTVTPSMYPDFVLDVDCMSPKEVLGDLLSITYTSGENFFSHRYSSENILNMVINPCSEATRNQSLLMGRQCFSFKYLGVSLINRQHGTGYHQPYGVWISSCKDDFDNSEDIVETTSFKAKIVKEFVFP